MSDNTAPAARAPVDLTAFALKVGKWLVLVLAILAATVAAGLVARYFPGAALPALPAPPAVAGDAAPAAALAAEAEPPEPLRFCGAKLTLAERLAAQPWPTKRITWSIDTSAYTGVLTRAQVVEAIDVAFKSWARDLDFEPAHVEAEAGALVRMRFATIDGKFSILAQSELADGTLKPKRQEYDAAEPWTISSNPGTATIDLVRVAAHEIGHVLGLEHDAENSGALMAPIYSRTVRFPTERDVAAAVTLGYKRRSAAGPHPSPAAPPITLSVTADPARLAEALRKAGYKVELLNR